MSNTDPTAPGVNIGTHVGYSVTDKMSNTDPTAPGVDLGTHVG
jgi:hypothetical protein